MFHVTNLGDFGGDVKPFADLRGYVPEPGDHWAAFDWDAAIEWDAEAWDEHVEAAVLATEEAERLVSGWRLANL